MAPAVRQGVFKMINGNSRLAKPDLELQGLALSYNRCAAICLIMKGCKTFTLWNARVVYCQFLLKKGTCLERKEFDMRVGVKMYERKVFIRRIIHSMLSGPSIQGGP